MNINDVAIATFTSRTQAEDAIHKLAGAGFDISNLSIVGRGYHTEEKVIGFYNAGDRIKFWGKNGAFWGGLWGLFAGGLFMTVPIIGPVMVLGHFGAMVIAALEGAAIVGGISALGAALVGIGVPKDSVVHYEEVLKADGFLVFAHGSAEQIRDAEKILQMVGSSQVDMHEGLQSANSDHGNQVTAQHHAA
ncbi:MAG: general stress protein [Betaproteobacteria bacterium]